MLSVDRASKLDLPSKSLHHLYNAALSYCTAMWCCLLPKVFIPFGDLPPTLLLGLYRSVVCNIPSCSVGHLHRMNERLNRHAHPWNRMHVFSTVSGRSTNWAITRQLTGYQNRQNATNSAIQQRHLQIHLSSLLAFMGKIYCTFLCFYIYFSLPFWYMSDYQRQICQKPLTCTVLNTENRRQLITFTYNFQIIKIKFRSATPSEVYIEPNGLCWYKKTIQIIVSISFAVFVRAILAKFFQIVQHWSTLFGNQPIYPARWKGIFLK